MMYVPRGFAHGFMTLADNTEVFYFSSEFYAPKLEKGIRYNDPKLKIKWPNKVKIISNRDLNFKNIF